VAETATGFPSGPPSYFRDVLICSFALSVPLRYVRVWAEPRRGDDDPVLVHSDRDVPFFARFTRRMV